MRDQLLHGIDWPSVGTDSRHLVWRTPDVKDRSQVPVAVLTRTGLARLCSNIAVTQPRTAWPEDFLYVLGQNCPRANPKRPAKSWEFHLVALLWDLQPVALRRSDIVVIKAAMGEAFESYVWADGDAHPEWFPSWSPDADDDVIQHVNKSGQWGVKHEQVSVERPTGGKTTYFLLRRPLEFNLSARALKAASQPFATWEPPLANDAEAGDTTDKAVDTGALAAPGGTSGVGLAGATDQLTETEKLYAAREEVLAYLAENWLNVPPNKWTLDGHRDPDNKDSGGLCCQPVGYNRKMKAKYKFDRYGLPWCPTVRHLIENLDDFYPSRSEKEALLGALRATQRAETGTVEE